MALGMRTVAWVAALLAVAASPGALRAEQPAPKSEKIGELIRVQEGTRKQWLGLIQAMQQVARDLEKTDMATAKIIAAAAEKAQAAFVAEDMEKVVQLLADGLIMPADATQAAIIKKLRSVLMVLRVGGDDEILSRILDLTTAEQLMGVIADILRKQRELERQSRYVYQGKDLLPRLNGALQRIRHLGDKQAALAKKTSEWEITEAQQKLTGGRKVIQGLGQRVDQLIKLDANPFPSPDDLANNLTQHDDLRRQTLTASSELRVLAGDPSLAGMAEILKNVVVLEGKAADEIEKARGALKRDDLKEARVADAEAKTCLGDALRFLTDGVNKQMASTGAGPLLGEQQAVNEEALKLNQAVEEVAPTAEQAGKISGAAEKVLRGSNPALLAEIKESGKPNTAFVNGPIEHLLACNKESAIMEQVRLARVFEGWL